MRKHRTTEWMIIALAAVATMFVYSSVANAAAKPKPGTVSSSSSAKITVHNTNAVAVAKPRQHVWAHVGTDPLVPGGVNSDAQLRHEITSGNVGAVLAKTEFSNSLNVNLIAKTKITGCTLHTNETSIWGSFGNARIEQNVKYTGPDAPARCFSLPVRGTPSTIGTYTTHGLGPVKTRSNGSKYRVKTTKKSPILSEQWGNFKDVDGCGNLLFKGFWSRQYKGAPKVTTTVVEVAPPKKHKPPVVTASITKTAELNGNPVTLVGGEYWFDVTINGPKGGAISNAASGSSAPINAKLKVGDIVMACEETPKDGFMPVQACITEKMHEGSNVFAFDNQKTVVATPTYTCQILSPIKFEGNKVTFNTQYSGSPLTTSKVNWGDHTANEIQPWNNPTSYTYNHDGVYNIIVDLFYADGGTAHCFTQISWPKTPPVTHYTCTASAAIDPNNQNLVHVSVDPNGPVADGGTSYSYGDGSQPNGDPNYEYAKLDHTVTYTITVSVTYQNGTTSDCPAYAEIKVCPPPVIDVCPNLVGDQATVPEGYELKNGECVPCPPPVICKDNEQKDDNGNCVPCPPPAPKCDGGDNGNGGQNDQGSNDDGHDGHDNHDGGNHDGGGDNGNNGSSDGGGQYDS